MRSACRLRRAPAARALAAALAAAAAPAVRAGDGPAPEPGATPNAIERAALGLDRVHRDWSDSLTRTVERFDRLFGDERIDDETDRTRVTVSLGLRLDERDGLRMKNRIRVHLALPNLEKRLLIFVEDAFESDEPDRLDALAESVRESRPLTGLRWVTETVGRARLTADAGVRVGSNPQILGRFRLSLTRPVNRWERRFAQTLGWFSADGFAASSELRWTRDLGEGRLFRSTTAVAWKEEEHGVTPLQAFTFLQSADDRSGHRWEARASWPGTPGCAAAVYTAEYAWRRRLHRDWLYLELGPGIEFRQEDDFAPRPFGAVRIEVAFGG